MPEAVEHVVQCPACEGNGWMIAGFGTVVPCSTCKQSGKVMLKDADLAFRSETPSVDLMSDVTRFYW